MLGSVKVFQRENDYLPIADDSPVIPAHWCNERLSHDYRMPIYSDNYWDLNCGIAAPNVETSSRFMNFDNYNDHFRELIKAFSWCAMNINHHALPVQLEAVSPSRVKDLARSLLRYCTFMEERGLALKDVTDEDNDAWMALFRERHYSSRVRAAAIPKRLYWYRHHLPLDVVNSLPWKDRQPNEVLGRAPSHDENTTGRIPRIILEPMFRWAMFYIDSAYVDVFNLAKSSSSTVVSHSSLATIPGTQVQWRNAGDFGQWNVKEAHYLVTAAYIVTAYLSGMRDSELQSIKSGAQTVLRDDSGLPYRHLVTATAFKKSKRGGGESCTWIVLPEVHRALCRLEGLAVLMKRVHPDHSDTQYVDHLFRRFRIGQSKVASLRDSSNRWLNSFQEHANNLADRAIEASNDPEERAVIRNLFKIPPTTEGRPWRWQSKQFRRTVAWYIANEPFGTVAGMRQYGHVREVTFQGYAGSVEAGFRDDIDHARAVGKMRDILEMYEDVRDGASLGGPMGAQLEQEFHTISNKLDDLPGKIVNEARLVAMLKNVAKEVYPGFVNDCFFDAATALCLRRPEIKNWSKPQFAQCDWEKCPNSCFWQKHQSALKSSLDEAKAYRRRPGLSKNQRVALDIMIEKYSKSLKKVCNAS